MTITLEHKKVYGNDLFYPQCKTSQLIVDLMLKKTFTIANVKKLQDVYTIDYKSDNPLL